MTIRDFYKACENFKHSQPSLMIYFSVNDFDDANSNWCAYAHRDFDDIPDELWDSKVGKFEFTSYSVIVAIDINA